MSAKSLHIQGVDVLLTHSYHLEHDRKQWRKMQPYPPLGTLYAATALRQAGVSVAVFDPMFVDPLAGFTAALKQHKPRLVVLYEDDFNFVTKMCLTHMRELACQLATLAKSHGCSLIAHGSDASDHPEVFLKAGIDYILNGEAEQALVELCSALLISADLTSVSGLIRPDTFGLRTVTATNPNWSRLPAPARDLIDLEPYRRAWTSAHGFFSTSVVASRGCPFGCNWCAKPISGNRFQLRSPQEVADELHALKHVSNVEHIWFGDDIFALDRHWMQAFAAAVERHGDPLPFKIQSRADLLTASTVDALKRSGCTEVWMGVESGSQNILDAMHKGITVSAVYAARERLAAVSIRACFFLQFGYPGEGWPEIEETVRLIRETGPDDVGISFSYPLPGTPFYNQVQKQLGTKRHWADSEDLCTLHTAAYTDEFYHALRAAIHAEVSALHEPSPIAELWDRVHALEPVSRNTNLIVLPPPATHFISLKDFVSSRSAPDA